LPGKFIICRIGDITNSEAEAIVNAANNQLWMGSGVAGAIKRKGGIEIEKEAIEKGPIDIGEAVVTSGGKLAQRYVIHAAAMGQDLRTDEIKIRNATRNALRRAEELMISSIDFPALGTGVGDYSVSLAAKIMIEEVKGFLLYSNSVKLVGFVLFDSETFKYFCDKLGGESQEI
jgi:O-acetyl-ADP-ribose deacetylase